MDLTPTESEALTPVEAVMRSEIAATVIGNVICSICFWLLALRVWLKFGYQGLFCNST